MKVVDLADEFGLTTSEAIDACLWAGVPADSSATELTDDDAEQIRGLMSDWIDAGFAPWRSEGGAQPGGAKGASGRSKSAQKRAHDRPPSARTGTDGPTTTIESPDGRSSAADPTASASGRTSSRAAASAAGARGLDSDAPPSPPLPASMGPSLPPLGGRPTGWLPGGPDAQPRLAPLAIIALALAISSLVVPFITAVLAIVLASVAKSRIDDSRGWLKGTKVATAAQIVAGIGVGLWLVLLVSELIVIQNKGTNPSAADIQVDLGSVAYDQVKIGDCTRLPKQGEISEWQLVKCDEAHQAEVFAQLPVANAVGLNYPGDGPIQSTAKADCRKKLSQYMQDPPEEASIETGFAYPSGQTWRNENDRTIWCVAFRKDGTLLGSSLKKPSTSTTSGSG